MTKDKKTKTKTIVKTNVKKLTSIKKEKVESKKITLLPQIKFATTHSAETTFEDFKGRTVILYFYPKDNTSGCTTQALEMTQLSKEFKKINAIVLGVSRDSLKSHHQFCEKFKLDLILVDDYSEILCQHFDVIKDKNMYGKQVRGIERSTFIISPDQKITHQFRKVKAAGHAQFILNLLKEK